LNEYFKPINGIPYTNNMPSEIIWEIAGKLDTKDMVHFSMINKDFYEILEKKRNKERKKMEIEKCKRSNINAIKLYKELEELRKYHPRRFYIAIKFCNSPYYK